MSLGDNGKLIPVSTTADNLAIAILVLMKITEQSARLGTLI